MDASLFSPPATGPLSAVAEEALIDLFERAPLAFYGLDREGRVLHANERFLDSLGVEAEDLPGIGFEALRHDLPPHQARAWFLQAFDRPGEVSVQGAWLRKDGTTMPVRMSVMGRRTATGDRLFVWGRDYTDEKRIAEQLAEGAELQRHLADGIYALSLARTREEVFQILMGRAAGILPGPHWFLGRVGTAQGHRAVHFLGLTPAMGERLGSAIQALGLPIFESGFAQEVYDHRRLCFVADAQASPEMVPASLAETHGMKGLLGVPLVFEGRLMGVLLALSFRKEAPLRADEGRFSVLQNLARIAALALERIQAEIRLEDSAGLARNLAAAVKDLAGATDEPALVATLFRWAAQLAPLPEWWFNHYDPASRSTSTTYWTPGLEAFGTPEDIRRPVSLDTSPLLAGMHRTLKGVHIPRNEGHPDLPAQDPWPYRTFIGLPLVHEGQVVGTLSGGSFGSQGYVPVSDDRFRALESLAEAGGLVINRLHDRRALEAEEARFRLLFEQSPDPILLLSGVSVADANAAALQLFGQERSEMLGHSMLRFCPEHQPDGSLSAEGGRKHTEGAHSGEHPPFEWNFLGARGQEVLCQVHLTRLDHEGQPILHAIVRDLTARKLAEAEHAALERQLFQAQKMESLGVLAGGIAHDFNNLLMGVLGHAGLALEQLNPLHPIRRNLESIQKAGQRAADLTRQMLAYSGRGQFVVGHLDLTSQVQEMLHLLKVSLPKTLVLNLDLHRRLPLVSADASQMQQVIMNLVINAAEAIGDASGTITLATGAQHLDEAAMTRMLVGQDAQPGTYAYLEVTDTGCGMDEATLSRIFEPFFTTKFTGRGLGLSALMGIIRGHKGALAVTSVPGRGSTFKALFPAQGIPEDLAFKPPQVPWKGQGLVLVVDDDETVRAVARQALELKGFDVLLARDGREAVDLVGQQGAAISLVLLDMTMPHMGGEAAFKAMRLLQPELSVILSSGYNELEALSRFTGQGLKGFIQKPYGPRELLGKVQAVLEA